MKCPPLESLEPRKLCSVDLYVSSVEFPIGTLGPNDTAQVPISIRNSGTNGVITPFTGRVYLSKDATLDDADPTVATFTISSIPAKTTSSLLVDIAMKNRVPKGSYFGIVMLDNTSKVREFDETNNVATSAFASMTVLNPLASPIVLMGTDVEDLYKISQKGDTITIDRSGVPQTVHSGDVLSFHLEMGGSNDQVYVGEGIVQPMFIHGGAGHDTLVGGSGADTIRGALGNDRIAGRFGNDWLYGDAGNDRLNGDAGADRLFGADGNDYLDAGSSNDWLYAGGGVDILVGGNGNDLLNTLDGETDTVDGGAGVDTGEEDPQDVLTSVEA